MSSSTLRVGTRGSALALTQTGLVVELLRATHGDLDVEVVTITTTGDKDTTSPFEAIGPKGIFVKELERALDDGRIDAAVHSLKDLPAGDVDGLVLAAVPLRGEARDVIVSRDGAGLDDLPAGAVVGTSSARRRTLLHERRPDLEAAPLRGNVDTRIEKVRRGDVDAAILAGAGLIRLGRDDVITQWLDAETFIPPPGQGALVVQTRAGRFAGDLAWISGAEDAASRACVDAEREFMRIVEGGCDVPLGAWARFTDGVIVCDGFVASDDHSAIRRARVTGGDPLEVGADLARRLA